KRDKNSKINISKYVFEQYQDKLNEDEISYFERLIGLYKNQKIPFSSIIVALQIYAVRFNDTELLNQTFFNPYPESLVNTIDSGKGRDL
ncbi:MAG: DUF1722 domain-containing protein, partial [Peptostreptococcaceae bacterium]